MKRKDTYTFFVFPFNKSTSIKLFSKTYTHENGNLHIKTKNMLIYFRKVFYINKEINPEAISFFFHLIDEDEYEALPVRR